MNDTDANDGSANEKTGAAFVRLYEIIKQLRAPGGCPWDREQTPATLRETLIEEAYETVEAINEAEADALKTGHVSEELGDVFLNAAMIAYMYEQQGAFSVTDALEDVSEKLVRRHPHVFGETAGFEGPAGGKQADTSEKVLAQWDTIKRDIEGRKGESVLDSVSMGMPDLLRAFKLQKKAAKAGFDWESIDGVWPKLDEELAELREAALTGDAKRIEDELGDLLFSVVNVARHLKVDPGVALTGTNAKFTRRFKHVERSMKDAHLPMDKAHFSDMDRFWDEAKKKERT
jgi:tetrapyrrole methylase family protein/MazG family protein